MSVSAEDRDLLVELGRVSAAADPVPAHVLEAARAVFALRDLDSELARLVEDTMLTAAGVRSGGSDTRLLTFETDDLAIELQVSPTPGGVSLLGQVVPAPAEGASVRLESAAGVLGTAEVDELGGFRFPEVAPALVRLHVEVPGAAGVSTPWQQL